MVEAEPSLLSINKNGATGPLFGSQQTPHAGTTPVVPKGAYGMLDIEPMLGSRDGTVCKTNARPAVLLV